MSYREAEFIARHNLERRVQEILDESGINLAKSMEIEQKKEDLKNALKEKGIEASVDVDTEMATAHVFVLQADGEEAEPPVIIVYLLPALVGEKVAQILARMPSEIRLNDLDRFAEELRERLSQAIGRVSIDDIEVEIDDETYEVKVTIDNTVDCIECRFELVPVSFSMPAVIGAVDRNSPRMCIEPITVPGPPVKNSTCNPRRPGHAGMRR